MLNSEGKRNLTLNDDADGHRLHSDHYADNLREIGTVISESLYLLEDQFQGPFNEETSPLISVQKQAPMLTSGENQWKLLSNGNSSVEDACISTDKSELLNFNIQMIPCLLIKDAIIPLTTSDLMYLLGDLDELGNDFETEAFTSSTGDTIQQQSQLPNIHVDEVLRFGRLQYNSSVISDVPEEGVDVYNISMMPCVITGTAIVPLSPADLLDLVGHKVDWISEIISPRVDQRLSSTLQYTNLVNVSRPSISKQLYSNHDVIMSSTLPDSNHACTPIISAAVSYSISTESSSYKNTQNNKQHFSQRYNNTKITSTSGSVIYNQEESANAIGELEPDSFKTETVIIKSFEDGIMEINDSTSVSEDFGNQNVEPDIFSTRMQNDEDYEQISRVTLRNTDLAQKGTYSGNMSYRTDTANTSIDTLKNEQICQKIKYDAYVDTKKIPSLATDMVYLIGDSHSLDTNRSGDIFQSPFIKFRTQLPMETAHLTQNSSTLPITQVLNSNEYSKGMKSYYLFGDEPLRVKHKIRDIDNTNLCTCKCAKISQMKKKRVYTRNAYKKMYPSSKQLLKICEKVMNSKPDFL